MYFCLTTTDLPERERIFGKALLDPGRRCFGAQLVDEYAAVVAEVSLEGVLH